MSKEYFTIRGTDLEVYVNTAYDKPEPQTRDYPGTSGGFDFDRGEVYTSLLDTSGTSRMVDISKLLTEEDWDELEDQISDREEEIEHTLAHGREDS